MDSAMELCVRLHLSYDSRIALRSNAVVTCTMRNTSAIRPAQIYQRACNLVRSASLHRLQSVRDGAQQSDDHKSHRTVESQDEIQSEGGLNP